MFRRNSYQVPGSRPDVTTGLQAVFPSARWRRATLLGGRWLARLPYVALRSIARFD